MTKRTAVEPEPVELDDVAAARARLQAAEAAAVEAREAEQATRRDRQIVARGEAQDLLEKLKPARAAVKAWRDGALRGEAVGPTRTRLFGPELLEAQKPALNGVATLEGHLAQAPALESLAAELAGPTLPAERLDAARVQLTQWSERFANIPRDLAEWYRLRAQAVAAHEALMRFSADHVRWLTPPEGA